mmetsp:Transcript_34125/g.82646  ORF Transcript_34125/g.82646 Transcript_34125/m.82646 type:complete len:93 (+) Transcript_34125:146-424(+)
MFNVQGKSKAVNIEETANAFTMEVIIFYNKRLSIFLIVSEPLIQVIEDRIWGGTELHRNQILWETLLGVSSQVSTAPKLVKDIPFPADSCQS